MWIFLFLVNNYNPNQNFPMFPAGRQSNNLNMFPQNLTNYYTSDFTSNINPQLPSNPAYNPYLQQQQQQQGLGQTGPGVGMGVVVSINGSRSIFSYNIVFV